VVALANVSLQVGRGEIVALCGENGAGKSTLMKILGAVHQDESGKPARRIFNPQSTAEMWTKELSDKTMAVGFFNRADKTVKVDFAWRELRLGASPSVRDLWIRRDLGRQKNFVAELPAHGGALLRVQ